MSYGLSRWCLLAIIFVGAAKAQAEVSADPTRPQNLPKESGFGAANDSAPTSLQTLIVPRKGKPSAVIDGQLVHVGEKIGDRRVVRISGSEVVLQGPEGWETLKMFQDIGKMPAANGKKQKRSNTERGGN